MAVAAHLREAAVTEDARHLEVVDGRHHELLRLERENVPAINGNAAVDSPIYGTIPSTPRSLSQVRSRAARRAAHVCTSMHALHVCVSAHPRACAVAGARE